MTILSWLGKIEKHILKSEVFRLYYMTFKKKRNISLPLRSPAQLLQQHIYRKSIKRLYRLCPFLSNKYTQNATILFSSTMDLSSYQLSAKYCNKVLQVQICIICITVSTHTVLSHQYEEVHYRAGQ